jgi:hypothetical protein
VEVIRTPQKTMRLEYVLSSAAKPVPGGATNFTHIKPEETGPEIMFPIPLVIENAPYMVIVVFSATMMFSILKA